jgi:MFS transporter, DHA1 family, inner membrane transport protein
MAALSAGTARPHGGRSVVIAASAVGVMILSYSVNAMDRTLFPLLLTDVRNEYGFGLPDAGLLSTIFTLGMAVAGLPTGFLMSRYSRKTVMQIGTLIFSIGTIVTVLSAGFADMLVYRAVTGVGEAMQLTALLAAFSSYFSRYRAAGVGGLNYAYAAGAMAGPALGSYLLAAYGGWRAPMILFGVIGLVMMVVVAAAVQPSISEANTAAREAKPTAGGAPALVNFNTAVLTLLSILFGLALYGYLGMYPTFLREELHFAPADAGSVMTVYGLGVLVSAGSGWLGDRFPAPHVMSASFVFSAIVCALLFNGPRSFLFQAAFSFALGVAFSGTIFVNLAGYHVKSVTGDLAGRASGLFITCLYGSATVAGYAMGFLARQAGWTVAGNVQLVLLCVAGAAVSLLLRPKRMAQPAPSPAEHL